jgi:hypothetical protein
MFRFIALGYVAASWEHWAHNLGDKRLGLTENMRRKTARESAEQGIPEEMFDTIYGSYVMAATIAEHAAQGDDTLIDRLTLIFEQVVLRNTEFESTPTEETRLGLQSFFDVGVGLNLFLRWQHGMEENGVAEADRWDDLALAPIYDDRVVNIPLPATMGDCILDETDTLGYEIRSDARLGGYHLTTFLAEGDVANIVQTVTSGRLGTRSVKMPESRHIDVLRDLGFQEAVFPDGQRYRLSSWSGLSGVRKIKD